MPNQQMLFKVQRSVAGSLHFEHPVTLNQIEDSLKVYKNSM